MEMLGVEEWETSNDNEDKVYELDECFVNLDHYELLEQAVDRLRDAED
jgi:hypothetical protein